MNKAAIARLTPKEVEEIVFAPNWPDGLNARTIYGVDCDDKGREGGVWLHVSFTDDGDAFVMAYDCEHIQSEPDESASSMPSIRVRTYAGGGRNLRTGQALRWLARAMQLDKEDEKKRRGE